MEVILPFHVVDDYLFEAINSTIKALPENSRIITINTINFNKLTEGISDRITEINYPGYSYINALREAFKITNSYYVALMNSDDLTLENRFKSQIEILNRENFDICATNILKFATSKQGKIIFIPPMLGSPPLSFNEALLLIGSYRADATWCFRRSWAVENKLFDTETDVSDWCIGMRLMSKNNSVVLDEDHYLYRMHPHQITRRKDDTEGKFFYEAWKNLNSKLGFPLLEESDIRAIALPLERVSLPIDLEKISLWLQKVEIYLISSMPEADRKFIRSIFARRRMLISISARRWFLMPRDLKFTLPILIEYLRFRKHLRGSLKNL